MRFHPGPHAPDGRRGVSLLEAIAAVTILGILAAIVVPRLAASGRAAQAERCDGHCDLIDLQAALFRRNTGAWPAADLSDLAADAALLPDGLPTCPVDGTVYAFDRAAGRCVRHAH